MILIIFAVSGMLNNNFTQIYVFQNTLNIERQPGDRYVLVSNGSSEFPICYGDGNRLDEVGACAVVAARSQRCIKKIDTVGSFLRGRALWLEASLLENVFSMHRIS